MAKDAMMVIKSSKPGGVILLQIAGTLRKCYRVLSSFDAGKDVEALVCDAYSDIGCWQASHELERRVIWANESIISLGDLVCYDVDNCILRYMGNRC